MPLPKSLPAKQHLTHDLHLTSSPEVWLAARRLAADARLYCQMSECLFSRYCEPYAFESDEFYCQCFVRSVSPGIESECLQPEREDKVLDGLTDLMTCFIEKGKATRKEFDIDYDVDMHQMQPSFNFCLRKLRKYLNAYCAFVDDFFLKAADHVSVLLAHITEMHKDGVVPYCLPVSDVEYHFVSLFEAVPFVASVVPKLRRLRAFLNKYRFSVRMPSIPIEHVRAAMKESAAKVDVSTEFSAHGVYDDFLFCFVQSRQDFLDEIDELVKDVISQGGKQLADFRKVEGLVAKMVKSLKPIAQKDIFVVRCGIVRIFFDRLYVLSGDYLRTEAMNGQFSASCEILRCMTPRQMNVSDYLLTPEVMDQPFDKTVENEELLRNAIKDIAVIQFYTNPLDVMACVLRTLKAIEKFVRSSTSAQGSESRVYDVASQMSFDDFFPLFCFVFAADPPVNAHDVARLLSSAVGLITSSAMEFAKLFFTSAVEYIAHAEDEPFSQSGTDESYEV